MSGYDFYAEVARISDRLGLSDEEAADILRGVGRELFALAEEREDYDA